MTNLKRYIIALTNLYGIVPVDQVVRTYNQQNDESIERQDAALYLDLDMRRDRVCTQDEYFVNETVIAFDLFHSLMAEKAMKPYYVPPKDALLQYADPKFYPRPKQYHELLDYLEKHFFSDDEDVAEMLCEHISDACEPQLDIQEVLSWFDAFDLCFESEQQRDETLYMIMALASNIRMWQNNGHTPLEIFERYEKPKLKPHPDELFVLN